MYERFTDRARKVLQLANQEAQRFNHEYIGTEHILLGLVKEGSGVAANVLKNLDIDLRKIRLEVEKIVQSGPDMVTMGKLPQTPKARKVIAYAIEEASNLNHNYVGTEHLLLGLLREEESVGAQVLMYLGLKLEDVREEVLNLLGHPGLPAAPLDRALQPDTQQDRIRRLEHGLSALVSLWTKEPDGQLDRIRSLEQQLWNVRVVLGAVAGAIAGALLAASMGAVLGLILGGIVAALGRRLPAALAGGVTGVLLASARFSAEGGTVAGGLLGALMGFLIAEIGGRPNQRWRSWGKRLRSRVQG